MADVPQTASEQHKVAVGEVLPKPHFGLWLWRSDRDGERVTAVHSNLVIALAARHRLPAVYLFWYCGGLFPYGPEPREPYRRAVTYVDRILKGVKSADLQGQAATMFEIFINLKTAKGLDVEVLLTLLARTDEVNE